jgi:hypothetical protein
MTSGCSGLCHREKRRERETKRAADSTDEIPSVRLNHLIGGRQRQQLRALGPLAIIAAISIAATLSGQG